MTMVGAETDMTGQETNYPCRILPGKLSVSYGMIYVKLVGLEGIWRYRSEVATVWWKS